MHYRLLPEKLINDYERGKQMKLSIHQYIRGKPATVLPLVGSSYMESHGRRVNLGYDWMNIDAEWPDVFKLITSDGCATSAELSTDNRSDANFVSRELFMIDIDSGMNIQDLVDNDFYNDYGAGFYATPSHTMENHRFRIMFRTEQPITDSTQAKKLIQALLRVYDHADPACKDSTRIFYGTENCELCLLADKMLPVAMIEALCAMEDMFKEERTAEFNYQIEHKPLTNERRQRILDLLKQTFVGSYGQWRDIAWGLKAGGFALIDFQLVTTGMMREKSPEDAALVWNSGKVLDTGIHLGSVIHFLKQRHGEKCLWVSDEEDSTQSFKAKARQFNKGQDEEDSTQSLRAKARKFNRG